MLSLIFFLLFFITLIILFIGLIKPSKLSPSNFQITRKQILGYIGGAAFFFFTLSIIFADSPDNPVTINYEATPTPEMTIAIPEIEEIEEIEEKPETTEIAAKEELGQVAGIKSTTEPTTTPTATPAAAPQVVNNPTPTPTPVIQTATATPAPKPAGNPNCVNINTASKERLMEIKHIDEARSTQMLTLRPFISVDSMTRIHGIGPARLNDIKAEGLACL